MSDVADMDGAGDAPKKRGRLLILVVPLLALFAGVSLGFFGVFSPLSLMEKKIPKKSLSFPTMCSSTFLK
ncbi:hypothetical protein [Paracoccus cavernae]|uniref:hypothetical protein n=1 Tax=Paracoccus cavernae TaxID=1571207 RepID=UPI003634167E